MAPLYPFDSGRRVVAAVSGGADSMALALLLAGWGAPHAAIIDHGLRPESAEEAALTRQRLRMRGIPAEVIRLPPFGRGAARARAARYSALDRACRDAGITDLVAAHHAQDQAETYLIRRHAGSGPAGLAAMPAIATLPSARLLRPLLGVSPVRLRATLSAAGWPWVEDPSNRDLRTARAQVRQTLTESALAEAHAAAVAAGRARRAAEGRVAAVLAAAVSFRPEGVACIDGDLPPEALAALVWTISGRPFPPSPRLVARQVKLRPGTLHGVAVLRWKAGWLLAREAAAMAAPVPAVAGAVWDGRFRLLDGIEGAELGALGDDAARLRHLSRLPAAALRTVPALRRGGELISVPHLGFPDAARCRSVSLMFAPARSAAGAPFACLCDIGRCDAGRGAFGTMRHHVG